MATDLEHGNACMINSGELSRAILASSAVPPLIRPVPVDGHLLVDGGLRNNLPTGPARLTGATVVVGVLSDNPIKVKGKKPFTKVGKLAGRVTDIMEAEIDSNHLSDADLIIYPKGISETPAFTTDPREIRRTILAGETAAKLCLPKLKELLEPSNSAAIVPEHAITN